MPPSLSPLQALPDVKFLEIGCFEGTFPLRNTVTSSRAIVTRAAGRATRWMLENILTGEGAHATVVDTFAGGGGGGGGGGGDACPALISPTYSPAPAAAGSEEHLPSRGATDDAQMQVGSAAMGSLETKTYNPFETSTPNPFNPAPFAPLPAITLRLS